MKTFYSPIFNKITCYSLYKTVINAFKQFDLVLLFSCLTLATLLSTGSASHAQEQKSGKIHVGLIYPLSSNGRHAPLDTNCLSLNLLAGVSSVEQGFTFAGISNIVHNDASGTQIAAFSNHIGKKASGAQIAGFMNTYGEGKGLAFAGFANIASGSLKGGQFAGFTNIAKDVKGIQVSGFLNTAANVKGTQLAGFINLARKNVSESQVAGFINIAKDVKGAQIAGFINIANKVGSAQIAGFMNIADSSDYPIGIINIIKNGEKSLGISTDETLTTMLSFRSGGKVLYGIIGIGYNFNNRKEVYAMEAGFGAHLLQSRIFRLNTELIGTTLESFKAGEYFKSSLKVMPALKLSRNIEIFGGPTFNFLSTSTDEGRNLYTKFIHSWENKHKNNLQALYIGYGGGIQVLF